MGKLSNISPFKGFEKDNPLFDKWLGILWGALRGDITTDAFINGWKPPVQTDPIAITSGTAVSLITTVPSWARRVTVTLDSVSTNGTSPVMLQIGPVGGLATANYMGSVSRIENATGTLAQLNTNGFRISNDHGASVLIDGRATFELHSSTSNIWVFDWNGARDDTTARTITGAGRIALSGALTQITITTVGGADTFDGAGTARVRYEY